MYFTALCTVEYVIILQNVGPAKLVDIAPWLSSEDGNRIIIFSRKMLLHALRLLYIGSLKMYVFLFLPNEIRCTN